MTREVSRSSLKRSIPKTTFACALLLALLVGAAACSKQGLPKVGSKLPQATFTSMADGSSLVFPSGLDGRPAMVGFWQPG